jgi:anti-sigma factor RsiW
MSELAPLNDDERAELVAFLDGEVNEQTARSLEARINRDPAARAEAEALRRTWEMLDYLPRPEPSPSFTHRTVERISALHPAHASSAVRWRWWAGMSGWAAAVVLCGVAGYAAVNRFYPKEPSGEDMARDLRVIENLRSYEAADDIEFLQALDHPDEFGEDSLGS